jgi:hypothetical protein
VTIEVMLREGPIDSNNDINLISGDTLKASTVGDLSNLNFSDNLYDNLIEISNQIKTLEQGTRRIYNDIISGIWYYTATDAKYRDKEFTVSLLRGNQNDAANSVVRLPPDISISVDELASSSIVSRSGTITVRWSMAGDSNNQTSYPMQVTGYINCSNGESGGWQSNIFDSTTGNYVVPSNEVSGFTGQCIVTIGVESSTLGSADPALHPTSFIRGHQYRTLAIATVE